MSIRPSVTPRFRTTVLAAALCGSAVIATPAATATAAADPVITLTDLGTLGGASSIATRMNERGQVVGWAETAAGDQHAFLWQRGVMTDLGTLGGTQSFASDINDRGQVTGWATTADGSTRAFGWQRGVMTDLGTPAPFTSAVYGSTWRVNAGGRIAGDYVHTGDDVRSYLWDRGRLTDLGNLGLPLTRVTDLNDSGDVLGLGMDATGASQSYLWRDGTMTGLGTPVAGQQFIASDLNNRGQVAGSGATARSQGRTHAVLWQRGRWSDLGRLDGDTWAHAVNERGTVVGAGIVDSDQIQHAFIARGGTITDLGTLGLAGGASAATGVNDHDQVIGGVSTPGGAAMSFLWQHGKMHRLPGLGADGDGAADITNQGRIAGMVGTPAGGSHAAVWTVKR